MTQYDEKKILDNCRYIKGLLMIAVVMGHSIAFWARQNWFDARIPSMDSPILFFFSKYISHFHVYAFALISGYIFSHVTQNGGYSRFSILLQKKCRRLIFPYCFTLLVWVVPFYCFFYHPSVREIVIRFVLGTHVNQLWFLLMLFEVFCIAWLVLHIWPNSKWAFPLASMGLYVVGGAANLVFPNCFQIWKSFQFLIFFYAGYYLNQNKVFISGRRLWELFLLDTVLFVILLFYVDNRMLSTLLELVSHMLGAVSAFFMINTFCEKCRRNRTIEWAAQNSFGIYLFHQQIIWCVIAVFNGRVLPSVNAMLNFIIGITLSFLLARLIERLPFGKMVLGT